MPLVVIARRIVDRVESAPQLDPGAGVRLEVRRLDVEEVVVVRAEGQLGVVAAALWPGDAVLVGGVVEIVRKPDGSRQAAIDADVLRRPSRPELRRAKHLARRNR